MELINLLPAGILPYEHVWQLQKDIHAEVAAGARENTIIFTQHQPTYTAGARTNGKDLAGASEVKVLKVDRGGRITYHGPGQLTVYPIIKLAPPLDVVQHVRLLEQAVIDFCRQLGISAFRICDRSGVWVAKEPEIIADANFCAGPHLEVDAYQLPQTTPASKICAIGCRVARGATMHGIGLNCTVDLEAFSHIVPCGISDAPVTSLAQIGAQTGHAELAKTDLNVYVPSLFETLVHYLRQESLENEP